MTENVYEYGYVISAGGETKTTILGQVSEQDVEAKRKEVETANRAQYLPLYRGLPARNPVTYFVQPVKSIES